MERARHLTDVALASLRLAYVHLEWSTGRCSLGESSREALDERGRAALSAVFDEVVRAFAEASAPPR